MWTMTPSPVLVMALLLCASSAFAQTTTKTNPVNPAIVFVCEHGAAKSVIATAYFNKLAAERGLPYRATFRGTSPQEALSVRAVQGLTADGVAIPAGAPTAIGAADIENATHIFAIGCRCRRPRCRRASRRTGRTCPTTRATKHSVMRSCVTSRQLLDDLQRRGK